jgi:predicted membrane-bound spermidine synthase
MKNSEIFIPPGPQAKKYSWYNLIYFIFFLSGFSAMVYQIVWQRCLFRMYGINIESVTIIVAVFMLGLGLGCIMGGQISLKTSDKSILLFGLLEFGIGLFGLFSIKLFNWVGYMTLAAGIIETALCSFMLLLIPTLLMGTTLPLLISYWTVCFNSVGFSVSRLYFINTLGSAIAASICVIFTFKYFGLTHSACLAASLNLFTAAIAIICYFIPTHNAPSVRVGM